MKRLWLIAALASCGASVQEVQISLYAAEELACSQQADSFDAGLACIAAIRQAHCGPSGIWADAGICPDGDIR